MSSAPTHSFDVLVVHSPPGTVEARVFADRLRRVSINPWLIVEQLGHVDAIEGLQLGLQYAQHVGLMLEPELTREPWLPEAMALFGQARQRGQRVLAWGFTPWDTYTLGPAPEGMEMVPEQLTEDERLWLAASGLWGQPAGHPSEWQKRGQEIWIQPLWDKDAQAQELVVRGDLYGAADLYSDILDADPDQIWAQIARGRIYLDLGDFSRAMSDFMTAADVAGDIPEADLAMGDLFFARKDYSRAIDHYTAALEQQPDHALALARRGLSFHYRKQNREARADLERAEQLDPDIPNLATYVAMVRRKSR